MSHGARTLKLVSQKLLGEGENCFVTFIGMTALKSCPTDRVLLRQSRTALRYCKNLLLVSSQQ